MKVSTRLLLLLGVMSVLLIGVGGLGYYGISKSNDALRKVYAERTVPAGQLGEVGTKVLVNQVAAFTAIMTPLRAGVDANAATVDANNAEADKLWANYMALPLSEEERQLAVSVDADRKKLAAGITAAFDAMREKAMVRSQVALTQTVPALYAPVQKGISDLTKMQLVGAEQEFLDATASFAVLRIVSLVAILGGLVFAGGLALLTLRSIYGQLGCEPAEAARIAQSVGAGDLSGVIEVKPGDHHSLLAQLKAMQDNLTQVVTHVRQGSESVQTASAEIAHGNMDLSTRTEQQASALEETAASMEELSSTVKQNADSARQANQLAMNASTVAVRGGDVVGKVVETMKGINESSRRIADIISVIDGIAFQTNILALNAAVEAARAGEQGRGFAVVASEVRSLAQRSAEAAKEIKTLINASVERVEHGTTLVDQAGVTMSEVVSSIRRVTDIVGEISAASNEQATGVAQVGEAVGHMDRTTQQNAALVEEMAAAAGSLNSQAQGLVASVAVFILPTGYQGQQPELRALALHTE